jgi:cytochrome c2
MLQHTRFIKKTVTLFAVVFIVSLSKSFGQDGKALFGTNCASCHKVDKDLTGPALMGVEDRWPDKKNLHAWIHNNSAFRATGDKYANDLFNKWNHTQMNLFPNLSDADIDAILKYIREYKAPVTTPTGDTTAKSDGDDNSLLFGIITLVLALAALILLTVNSNLKKLADEKNGTRSPEPVAFYRNKSYLATIAVVCFVLAGVWLSKAAQHLGRSQNYQPVQPIYYSHKVHAGINQINCLYCHGGAQAGKQATIPSINICMNCHMAINSYAGAPIKNEAGDEVNGTAEIQKLYKYAGFDPAVSKVWDPSKAKPIAWVRIHNLPDHVYFNHAQHVVAGKQQCQTCHGEITAMNEVYQFSQLSMSWCINCHRETKVQFNDDKGNGNKFYSIYEKFHEDIKQGKYDSVTVEKIGGTECQKCHY